MRDTRHVETPVPFSRLPSATAEDLWPLELHSQPPPRRRRPGGRAAPVSCLLILIPSFSPCDMFSVSSHSTCDMNTPASTTTPSDHPLPSPSSALGPLVPPLVPPLAARAAATSPLAQSPYARLSRPEPAAARHAAPSVSRRAASRQTPHRPSTHVGKRRGDACDSIQVALTPTQAPGSPSIFTAAAPSPSQPRASSTLPHAGFGDTRAELCELRARESGEE